MATRSECQGALSLYEGALLEFKNVVGAGIVTREEQANQPCFEVAVYVVQKIPYDDLDPDDVLPSYLQVIDDVKGVYKVPTCVIEIGPSGERPGSIDPQNVQ